MSHEKPDLLRQSEGFERVHASLTVPLIATRRDGDKDRPGVRVCRLDDSLAQVRAANINPVFDFLPVEETSRDIVGLFSARSSSNADDDHGELLVRDRMCPLSEADLIGADATILDFIRRVRPKPCSWFPADKSRGWSRGPTSRNCPFVLPYSLLSPGSS